jgi:hypothetical protein
LALQFQAFLDYNDVGSVFPATNRQWFWPRVTHPKGLAMLIRSEMQGIHGKSAVTAAPEAIPAASLSTRLPGGLLLLICP